MALLDRLITREAAIAFNQPFDSWIVDFAHNEFHGASIQRMGEAAELPRAKVTRNKEDPLTPAHRLLVMFEAFTGHQIRDVVPVQRRKVTELDQQSPEIGKCSSKNGV